MLGLGGGQISVPFLYFMGLNFKKQAIPLGLLISLISSSSASFTYLTHKLPDKKVYLKSVFFLIPGAILGSVISHKLNVKELIYIFAFSMMFSSLILLFKLRPKKIKSELLRNFILCFFSFLIGIIGGITGKGGGAFFVPLFYFIGLEPKIAIATSALTVFTSSFTSFLTHLKLGADLNFKMCLLTALTVIISSQLGSKLMAKKLNSEVLRYIFAIVLIIISVILILKEQ
jgi:hypothetical protein